MSQFFVHIELKGAPAAATYQKLHSLMQSEGWSVQISGTDGTTNLPHAMYTGRSQSSSAEIGKKIYEEVQSNVWEDPFVLVMKADDWAMTPA